MRAGVVCTVVLLALGGCAAPPEQPGDAPRSDLWRLAAEARASPEGVSASEVSAAADPTDPDHVVAAANSQGGFGVYVTFDAGQTWEADIYPASRVDPPPGGQGRFVGLSDPVVSFAADGTVYLAGLSIIPTSTVFVASSNDGGLTWSDGRIVHESDLAASFNDKEWLAVGPTTGTLLVAWQKEPLLDSLRSVEASTGVDADIGDIVLSRSTDQGETWSLPVRLSRGLHNNGTQLAFSPDGTAHLLWVNYEEGTLDYAVSNDDGVSWSEPKAVASVHVVPPFGRYARMHTLPALAASPIGPDLYAVWHDARNLDADVYAVASPDGGATWGAETRVHRDPMGNGAIQLYPWAVVDPAGRLHVTYYDSRNDVDHPRFEYWHSVANGSHLSFDHGRPASTVNFTVFSNPSAPEESHTFGDYTAVAASVSGIFPFWADGRHEETSVYASRIVPSTPG